MKELLFITNIPSPYRVSFFNEFGKYVNLTVVFEKDRSEERDKSWENYRFENFTGIIMRGMRVSKNTALCTEVCQHIILKKWDHIVVCDFSTPTGMLAMEFMIRKKIPYWIEGDGAFPGSKNGPKAKIKTHFIRNAKGLFSTSKGHDLYYIMYGASDSKIYRYPFSSLKAGDILKDVPSADEKKALRKELGIVEEQVVIAVGQFIPRKGFDILLAAAAQLSRSIGFYFIGGSATEEYQEIQAKYHLTNAHFITFKKKSELYKFYKAADVFAFPTREDIWGLVVNEAMACGLPVVSTQRCGAALELVKNGENGYIIPVDNVAEMKDKIEKTLSTPTVSSKMGKRSLEIIEAYTIEKMVQRHREILVDA